jgi:hypothetical protein
LTKQGRRIAFAFDFGDAFAKPFNLGISSGLCFPPCVATESASLAAGQLSHRRNTAKIVSRSRLVNLTVIGQICILIPGVSIRPTQCCHAIVTLKYPQDATHHGSDPRFHLGHTIVSETFLAPRRKKRKTTP